MEQTGSSARVYRTSYAGIRGKRLGTLSDHAELISACFALASAGAEPQWITRAQALLNFVGERARQRSPDGGWALAESLEADELLSSAQNGPMLATPLDGPEPGGIGAAVLLQDTTAPDFFSKVRAGQLTAKDFDQP